VRLTAWPGLGFPGASATPPRLALAAATKPGLLASALARRHNLRRIIAANNAEAACIGGQGGADGVVGTRRIGWVMLGTDAHRTGGWGFCPA